MKILYVLNSGNPGGMEKHVLDLVSGMKRNDHEVFVWCPGGPMAGAYTGAGAQVTLKGIASDLDLRFIGSLSAFIKKQGIHVIHAHELKSSVNAMIAAHIVKTPVVVTHIHTPMSEWRVGGTFKKVITAITWRLYSWMVNYFSDTEIALTESRKSIKITEGIKSAKIRIIPNAIKLDKFVINSDDKARHSDEIRRRYEIGGNKFIIGNVSRMTEEKGHVLLINAFSDVVNSGGNGVDELILFLAGGGKLEAEVRRRVNELKLNERVIVTGIFDEADLVKYYSAFNMFVFPSLAEGFGYVLAEAVASGLPALVSDLEVLHEVAGDNVSFFKAGDLTDLAAKIISLHGKIVSGDPDGLHLDENVERIKHKFSMSVFIKSYEDLYQEILKK